MYTEKKKERNTERKKKYTTIVLVGWFVGSAIFMIFRQLQMHQGKSNIGSVDKWRLLQN